MLAATSISFERKGTADERHLICNCSLLETFLRNAWIVFTLFAEIGCSNTK